MEIILFVVTQDTSPVKVRGVINKQFASHEMKSHQHLSAADDFTGQMLHVTATTSQVADENAAVTQTFFIVSC